MIVKNLCIRRFQSQNHIRIGRCIKGSIKPRRNGTGGSCCLSGSSRFGRCSCFVRSSRSGCGCRLGCGQCRRIAYTACRIALIDCILQRNGIAAAFEITASLIVIFGPGGGDINGCITGCCLAGDRRRHTEEHGKDQSQSCNFPINLFH